MSGSNRAKSFVGSKQPAGSPPQGEPVFLAVGKLRRPHGIRGEMLMEVLTDFPERLKPGVGVYVGPEYKPERIRSCRWHSNHMLVAFDGYPDPETTGVMRNYLVFVRSEDRPVLPEGEYYHHQLVGLKVVHEDGAVLGVLEQILETGANDVYVVRPETGPEILLPAIDSVILDINLETSQMRVHILPGLLPE